MKPHVVSLNFEARVKDHINDVHDMQCIWTGDTTVVVVLMMT